MYSLRAAVAWLKEVSRNGFNIQFYLTQFFIMCNNNNNNNTNNNNNNNNTNNNNNNNKIITVKECNKANLQCTMETVHLSLFRIK